jgi:hypothetical protein
MAKLAKTIEGELGPDSLWPNKQRSTKLEGDRKTVMKAKAELQQIIDLIASKDSPVGMDAVYVHALILDKLNSIETRLTALEEANE